MQLQSAMIFVKDLPRMAEFYGEVLGLRPVAGTRTESWAEFSAGAASVALHAIPPEIASQFEITSPPQPREEYPVKLIFSVTDLDAEQARLERLGVTLTRRPWGACDAVDPEGNIFQICQGM